MHRGTIQIYKNCLVEWTLLPKYVTWISIFVSAGSVWMPWHVDILRASRWIPTMRVLSFIPFSTSNPFKYISSSNTMGHMDGSNSNTLPQVPDCVCTREEVGRRHQDMRKSTGERWEAYRWGRQSAFLSPCARARRGSRFTFLQINKFCSTLFIFFYHFVYQWQRGSSTVAAFFFFVPASIFSE